MPKKRSGFSIIPNKLLDLGLDPFDIAVFLIIKRNNPSHPGYQHFKNKLNISRGRLWKSLNVLKQCNILNWDRGMTGKSNLYFILGEGVWIPKKTKPNQYTTYTTSSTPHELGVVHYVNPNNTNSIILNNKRELSFSSLVEKLQNQKKVKG